MKIPSTSDYSLIYSLLYNNTNANRTTTTQATSNSQQVSGITNIDGDSFKLSGAGNTWRGSLQGSDDNSNALDLKNFLDKVKNGTVTQDDIAALKEKLNSIQETAGAAPPPPPKDDNGLGADIKSFLDKVKNGTVTDDDLKALQSELNQADEQNDTSTTAQNSTNYLFAQFMQAYDNTNITS